MKICVPELYCPFPSAASPHAGAVQTASVAWAARVGLVTGAAPLRKLAASRIGWLVARGFPAAPRAPLQIAADWTTLFCLLDDRAEALDPLRLGAWLGGLHTAFRDGAEAPDGDPFVGALLDLRARLLERATAAWTHRFAARVEEIFVGFTWEAVHRAAGRRPELGTYRAMREVTVGLRPLFQLGDLTDDIKLPSEVRAHPSIGRLAAAASNVVGWANDLFTCEREAAAGEVHNLVLVLMDHEALPLPAALALAAAQHDDEVRAFLAAERALPSFGDADPDVERFVALLRAWMRGHLDWARETGRYRAGTGETGVTHRA